MHKILHDIEVITRDFFALHWNVIKMPFVMVAVNIMFLVFIAITR